MSDTKRKKILSKGYLMGNGKFVSLDAYNKASGRNVITSLLATKAEDTQRIDSKQQTALNGVKLAEPPMDLDNLAELLLVNTPHYRATRAKSNDSVGKGWQLVPADGESGNEAERERALALLKSPSKRESLTQILKCMVLDLESVGNMGMEMVLGPKEGEVRQLNHVPATTLKVSQDFTVLRHEVGQEETWFKSEGMEGEYDKETGERDDGLVLAQRANPMFYRRKYHPSSDHYGLPDNVPALGAMSLDVSARNFNLDFFENGAIPAYVVVIEGADVTPKLEKFIEDFFNYELKGEGNSQRTMVLPIAEDGVTVKIEKVSADVKEAHFRHLKETNRDEVLSADGVPPNRAFYFQVSGIGRDQSKELNRIYREQTIQPIQEEVEDMMNIVLETYLKVTTWRFKLKSLQFDDRSLAAEVVLKAFQSKTLDTNERRRLLSPLFDGGLEDKPGGDALTLDEFASEEDFGEKRRWARDYTVGLQTDAIKNEFDRFLEGAKIEGLEAKAVTALQRQGRRLRPLVKDSEADLLRALNEQEKRVKAAFDAEAGGAFFKFWRKQDKPVNITAVLRGFDGTEDLIEESITQTRARSGEKAFRAAGKEVDATIAFNIQSPAVNAFITSEVGALSKSITATSSDRIRRTLARGILKGETNEKLAKRVAKVFESNKSRSLLIARTETARAFNEGTMLAYRESGKVTLVDVIDVGEPGDEGCLSANGQKWTTGRALSNPLEHPNCVRTFAAIVDEGR